MRPHALKPSKLSAVTANFVTLYPQKFVQLEVCALACREQVLESKPFGGDNQSEKIKVP